ncbi:MAG: hypothetical protein H7A21_01870 [Spirochaetales bacterium]|nr:hypothetical protein [Spirochaetales bacterium]MCP5485507.1 hypothetical protein [Spirochaetales bacterium]
MGSGDTQMDAGKIEEYKMKLQGQEGMAAGLLRAALQEAAAGNAEFGRGLEGVIADLPDANPALISIARELEALSGK